MEHAIELSYKILQCKKKPEIFERSRLEMKTEEVALKRNLLIHSPSQNYEFTPVHSRRYYLDSSMADRCFPFPLKICLSKSRRHVHDEINEVIHGLCRLYKIGLRYPVPHHVVAEAVTS